MTVKALRFRPSLAKLAYVLTRAALKLPLAKKLSAATRETMPMGYVLVARKPYSDER